MFLVTEKIVREHTEIKASNKGMTIGQLVDEKLSKMVAECEECHKIELVFETPERWYEIAKFYDGEKTATASVRKR